ncbi:MAG: helix-hairpin-helix domain-containing protein [Actinomycetota bacterium]
MEERGFVSRLAALAGRVRATPAEMGLLLVLAAVVLGGAVLVYARTSRPAPPMRPLQAASPTPSPTPSPSRSLVVHVAGMVAAPGVYELPAGSRVKDAIAAAGGSVPGGDPDALNLAAPVTDGQRVVVPRPGDVPAQAAAGETLDAAAKVNLNTATAEQLDELPGVGPVLAQRVVDYRRRGGRFSSVRQLLEVDGFGPKKLEDLKDRVTV